MLSPLKVRKERPPQSSCVVLWCRHLDVGRQAGSFSSVYGSSGACLFVSSAVAAPAIAITSLSLGQIAAILVIFLPPCAIASCLDLSRFALGTHVRPPFVRLYGQNYADAGARRGVAMLSSVTLKLPRMPAAAIGTSTTEPTGIIPSRGRVVALTWRRLAPSVWPVAHLGVEWPTLHRAMVLEHDALHDKANHEPGAIDEIHTKEQLSTGLLHDLRFQHERAALIYVVSARVVSRLCRGGCCRSCWGHSRPT